MATTLTVSQDKCKALLRPLPGSGSSAAASVSGTRLGGGVSIGRGVVAQPTASKPKDASTCKLPSAELGRSTSTGIESGRSSSSSSSSNSSSTVRGLIAAPLPKSTVAATDGAVNSSNDCRSASSSKSGIAASKGSSSSNSSSSSSRSSKIATDIPQRAFERRPSVQALIAVFANLQSSSTAAATDVVGSGCASSSVEAMSAARGRPSPSIVRTSQERCDAPATVDAAVLVTAGTDSAAGKPMKSIAVPAVVGPKPQPLKPRPVTSAPRTPQQPQQLQFPLRKTRCDAQQQQQHPVAAAAAAKAEVPAEPTRGQLEGRLVSPEQHAGLATRASDGSSSQTACSSSSSTCGSTSCTDPGKVSLAATKTGRQMPDTATARGLGRPGLTASVATAAVALKAIKPTEQLLPMADSRDSLGSARSVAAAKSGGSPQAVEHDVGAAPCSPTVADELHDGHVQMSGRNAFNSEPPAGPHGKAMAAGPTAAAATSDVPAGSPAASDAVTTFAAVAAPALSDSTQPPEAQRYSRQRSSHKGGKRVSAGRKSAAHVGRLVARGLRGSTGHRTGETAGTTATTSDLEADATDRDPTGKQQQQQQLAAAAAAAGASSQPLEDVSTHGSAVTRPSEPRQLVKAEASAAAAASASAAIASASAAIASVISAQPFKPRAAARPQLFQQGSNGPAVDARFGAAAERAAAEAARKPPSASSSSEPLLPPCGLVSDARAAAAAEAATTAARSPRWQQQQQQLLPARSPGKAAASPRSPAGIADEPEPSAGRLGSRDGGSSGCFRIAALGLGSATSDGTADSAVDVRGTSPAAAGGQQTATAADGAVRKLPHAPSAGDVRHRLQCDSTPAAAAAVPLSADIEAAGDTAAGGHSSGSGDAATEDDGRSEAFGERSRPIAVRLQQPTAEYHTLDPSCCSAGPALRFADAPDCNIVYENMYHDDDWNGGEDWESDTSDSSSKRGHYDLSAAVTAAAGDAAASIEQHTTYTLRRCPPKPLKASFASRARLTAARIRYRLQLHRLRHQNQTAVSSSSAAAAAAVRSPTDSPSVVAARLRAFFVSGGGIRRLFQRRPSGGMRTSNANKGSVASVSSGCPSGSDNGHQSSVSTSPVAVAQRRLPPPPQPQHHSTAAGLSQSVGSQNTEAASGVARSSSSASRCSWSPSTSPAGSRSPVATPPVPSRRSTASSSSSYQPPPPLPPERSTSLVPGHQVPPSEPAPAVLTVAARTGCLRPTARGRPLSSSLSSDDRSQCKGVSAGSATAAAVLELKSQLTASRSDSSVVIAAAAAASSSSSSLAANPLSLGAVLDAEDGLEHFAALDRKVKLTTTRRRRQQDPSRRSTAPVTGLGALLSVGPEVPVASAVLAFHGSRHSDHAGSNASAQSPDLRCHGETDVTAVAAAKAATSTAHAGESLAANSPVPMSRPSAARDGRARLMTDDSRSLDRTPMSLSSSSSSSGGGSSGSGGCSSSSGSCGASSAIIIASPSSAVSSDARRQCSTSSQHSNASTSSTTSGYHSAGEPPASDYATAVTIGAKEVDVGLSASGTFGERQQQQGHHYVLSDADLVVSAVTADGVDNSDDGEATIYQTLSEMASPATVTGSVSGPGDQPAPAAFIITESIPPPQLQPQQQQLWSEMPQVKACGILDAMSPAEMKLQEALFELFTTEGTYLQGLEVLVSVFLKSAALNDDSILPPDARKVLFCNVLDIQQVSQRLHRELAQLWHENIVMFDACDILARYADEKLLDVYIKYCSNQQQQQGIVESLRSTNPRFAEAVRQLERSPSCRGLGLSAYLLLPMQRVTRYPLLVDNIQRRLEANTSHEHAARKCHNALKEIVRRCNEMARLMEQAKKLLEIENHLRFTKVKKVPIVSAARQLLKKAELSLISDDGGGGSRSRVGTLASRLLAAASAARGGGSTETRAVFLFSDMVLIAKKKSGGLYSVLDYASRAAVTVEALPVGCSPATTGMDDLLGGSGSSARQSSSPSNGAGFALAQSPPPAAAAAAVQRLQQQQQLTSQQPQHIFLLVLLQNHQQKHAEYLLSCQNESELERWLEALAPSSAYADDDERIYESWDCPQVRATSDYETDQADELSLRVGDVINVYRKMNDGWYEGERISDGSHGWFPSSCTEELPSEHRRVKHLRQRYEVLKAAAKKIKAAYQ